MCNKLLEGKLPKEILFGMFWDGFFACIAIICALKLAGINTGTAVLYFWVAAIVLAIFAIRQGWRISKEPKDNRLDDLINEVKELKEEIRTERASSKVS